MDSKRFGWLLLIDRCTLVSEAEVLWLIGVLRGLDAAAWGAHCGQELDFGTLVADYALLAGVISLHRFLQILYLGMHSVVEHTNPVELALTFVLDLIVHALSVPIAHKGSLDVLVAKEGFIIRLGYFVKVVVVSKCYAIVFSAVLAAAAELIFIDVWKTACIVVRGPDCNGRDITFLWQKFGTDESLFYGA